MNSKKSALVVSLVALILMVGMFVGVGTMFSQTTQDLGVALAESTSATVIAVDNATEGQADPADEMEGSRAKPLGESRTVWANRSQTLAGVIAMEVVGIGVLGFAVGFIASRIVKRSLS